MNEITHATVIPLIGGLTIAVQNILNKRPEYILSYSGFKNNDSQLLSYYNNEVPYYNLDEVDESFNPKYVDIVCSVPPCAGLSSLSTTSCAESSVNDWMMLSAEYTLNKIQPKVYFGENAPALGTNKGRPVALKLKNLAEKYGYSFSIFKTQSIKHGLSQVRNRTFYFFWKLDSAPIFPHFNKDHERIEDLLINSINDDEMGEVTNKNIPTQDPYYKYVLEVLHENKLSHKEFCASLNKSIEMLSYIESHPKFESYKTVANWMFDNGFDKAGNKCLKMHQKLASGGNIMRRGLNIPSNYIGAFVGAYPTSLVHPIEDRFVTYRECLNIMKMPKDFMIQNKQKNINMICQNVPVSTAEDMVRCIIAALYGKLNMHESKYIIQCNVKNNIEAI